MASPARARLHLRVKCATEHRVSDGIRFFGKCLAATNIHVKDYNLLALDNGPFAWAEADVVADAVAFL